jgi:hypothetical protein
MGCVDKNARCGPCEASGYRRRMHGGRVCERDDEIKRQFGRPQRARGIVDRYKRVSRPKRARWEKTGKVEQRRDNGVVISGRPYTRKSGESDPPCGRDSEKVMGDRWRTERRFGLNLRLGRPVRYSLYLTNALHHFLNTYLRRFGPKSN